MKTEQQQNKSTVCQRCGYKLSSPGEYHPEPFCVLVDSGVDPWELVRHARLNIPKSQNIPVRGSTDILLGQVASLCESVDCGNDG